MNYRWHFAEVPRGYTLREPINSEFFSTEAIKDHAEAVVREAVQNSLDARAPGSSSVRVHLAIVEPRDDGAAYFLDGLTPHLRAPRNGLRDHSFIGRASRALVVEDFGTTGLVGDPAAYFWQEDRSNPFFSFFRAEGHSDKSANAVGRWGVGKFVFPRCSRGSTFFGYSIRHDDRARFLMGRTILRSHYVGAHRHVPDGYFGIEDDALVLPVTDDEVLNRFRNCFRLRRTSDAGLSVVVPWIDEEIQFETLAQAAVSAYFLAILTGALELTIEEGNRTMVLTKSTLMGELGAFGVEVERSLTPLVTLAKWAVEQSPEPLVTCATPDPARAPKWSEHSLGAEQLDELRLALERGQPVRTRVPVTIRTKGGQALGASFDVVMEKAPDAIDDRPVFVRSGIVISDARGKPARGLRTLVLIGSDALGTLLGDAENPSHTEWRPDTANFKEKYVHGPSHLSFVKESAARLKNLMLDAEDKVDRHLLADFFSFINEGTGNETAHGGANKSEKARPVPPPKIPKSPARLRVWKIRGGFRITDGDPDAGTPTEVRVRIAYDTRHGNALKRWVPADFDLASRDIRIAEATNAVVHDRSGNVLRFGVTQRPFAVAVSGFDENRDLYVRADTIGTNDDSTKAELHVEEEDHSI